MLSLTLTLAPNLILSLTLPLTLTLTLTLTPNPSPNPNPNPNQAELRLVDAADLLAEQKGHLWLAVSAPEESAWRDALLARGFRLQSVVPGEHDGKWLFKGTPLRDRV